jgi:multiple sugar transport system permease protein
MTNGGPGISTQVSLQLITNTAFTDNRLGAASAASVLLFIVIIVIAIIRQLTDRPAAKKEA